MAVRTDPRFGFKYGWESGADGWGDDVNTDLQLLMLLFHLTAIDDTLTAPPGSPAVGDTYIPAATATGDWVGQENNIAVWWLLPNASTPAWLFITSTEGVRAWVQSGTPALKVFSGSAWIAA